MESSQKKDDFDENNLISAIWMDNRSKKKAFQRENKIILNQFQDSFNAK